MIVLDASVIIAHLDAGDGLNERATALLSDLAAEPLCASALTVAEVLVGPARTGELDRAIAVLDRLRIATRDLPADAPVRLAMLRAETNLKLPDCCVLLAAEQVRAAVATFDQRLAAVAAERRIAVRDGS